MPGKRWKRKPKFKAREVRQGVPCKFCGAAKGELCWAAGGVQTYGCHYSRHMDYERLKGLRPARGSKGLTVRYECPVCGGPHARADHPQAA